MNISPSPKFTAIFLTIVTAVSLATTDIYLPALPSMAKEFGTTQTAAQLTIGLYFLVFALGQLVVGPLSDHFGRRKVLLVSQGIFCCATLACVFMPTIKTLILMRMIQASGACAANVVGRAVIKDVFEREKAIAFMTVMGMAMAISPAVAPLLGGYIFTHWGWRSIFLLFGIIGAILFIVMFFRLPETNDHIGEDLQPRQLVTNYGALVKSPFFMRYGLSASLLNSGLYCIIISSPFILMNLYHVSPMVYSLLYSAHAFGFVIGAGIGGAIIKKMGEERMLTSFIALNAANGLILLGLCSTPLPNIYIMMSSTIMFSVLLGFVFPTTNIVAVMSHSKIAGTASALLSFMFFGVGALIGIGISNLSETSAVPMLASMGIVSFLGLLTFVVLKNPALAEARK